MAVAPVITGPRLRLRPFVRADIGPAYLSWLNDPERMKFSRQRERRHDEASSASYLDSFEGTPHYFWAVEETGSGRLVGTMTAYLEGADADVGILIGRPGQGLGTRGVGTGAGSPPARREEGPGTRRDARSAMPPCAGSASAGGCAWWGRRRRGSYATRSPSTRGRGSLRARFHGDRLQRDERSADGNRRQGRSGHGGDGLLRQEAGRDPAHPPPAAQAHRLQPRRAQAARDGPALRRRPATRPSAISSATSATASASTAPSTASTSSSTPPR